MELPALRLPVAHGGAVVRLPLRETPWPKRPEPRPCPVCGVRWHPWAGSYLPCHAACLFTEDEEDEVLAELEADPRLRIEDVARARGVTVAVLRSLLRRAQRRRQRVRRDAGRLGEALATSLLELGERAQRRTEITGAAARPADRTHPDSTDERCGRCGELWDFCDCCCELCDQPLPDCVCCKRDKGGRRG